MVEAASIVFSPASETDAIAELDDVYVILEDWVADTLSCSVLFFARSRVRLSSDANVLPWESVTFTVFFSETVIWGLEDWGFRW